MGQLSRLRPLRLPLQASPRRPVRRHRFSGGVAVCPCSPTLTSESSVLRHSVYLLCLWRGLRGKLPPPRKIRDFLGYHRLGGWQQPVRRSGKVVRGGAWNNNRDNARCAYRNRNHPDNRNNNIGFRVVLRSAHVLPPLLLVPPRGGTARRYNRAARVPEMPGRSAQAGLPAEAKEEEQRQTLWSARTPQGRAKPGASPTPGAYTNRGTARPSARRARPACLNRRRLRRRAPSRSVRR
ncbi:MAG: SUMF1/EgtB/PvdO family nonheme iron enzyme [Gammaproteobacteria bacterium]|nr:SUMF1/EgtB/PvdO family nonheme iron enzyme [Gammaproteobacteria bacterium]